MNVQCPLCKWNGRSHRFADHLDMQHEIGSAYGGIGGLSCQCCDDWFMTKTGWHRHVKQNLHKIIAALHARNLGVTP